MVSMAKTKRSKIMWFTYHQNVLDLVQVQSPEVLPETIVPDYHERISM